MQDEAWEFIKWMTAPEQLITNAKVGSKLPVRESLYDDPEVLNNVPVARLGKEAIIDNSTPRPVSPYYSDVSLELAEQFNASLSGDISPEDAVATLQEDLQQISRPGRTSGWVNRAAGPIQHAACGGLSARRFAPCQHATPFGLRLSATLRLRLRFQLFGFGPRSAA